MEGYGACDSTEASAVWVSEGPFQEEHSCELCTELIESMDAWCVRRCMHLYRGAHHGSTLKCTCRSSELVGRHTGEGIRRSRGDRRQQFVQSVRGEAAHMRHSERPR